MYNLLSRIGSKVSREGFASLLTRIVGEFRSPTTALSRKALDFIYSGWGKKQILANKEVLAIYDLKASTAWISFDFAWFLFAAEIFAKKNSKTTFELVVIMDLGNYGKATALPEYRYSMLTHNMEWRIHNILVPLVGLCSACSKFSIVEKFNKPLSQFVVFPQGYNGVTYIPGMNYRFIFDNYYGLKLEGLRAPKIARDFVEKWMMEQKIDANAVAITIRDYPHDKSRNSNLRHWVKFARYVETAGFRPIFILDTETSLLKQKMLSGETIFLASSWNMAMRIALFEAAKLNVFPNNGPASLAQLSVTCNYIATGIVNKKSPQTTEKMFRERGLKVGQRKFFSHFSNAYQVLSWEDDSFDILKLEFEKFLDYLHQKVS
jgi:hypothetical protein